MGFFKKKDLKLGGKGDEVGAGKRWGREVNRIKIDCMKFSKINNNMIIIFKMF